MYNNGYSSPEFTNNPFINDPRNPQTRFPDLSTVSGAQTQWLQSPTDSNQMGYQQAQGMYQQPSYQQQQPQLSPGYAQQTGYMSPGVSPGLAPQPTGIPFQPTSSFGQQLAANISGSSYGYLQGQNGQPQQQGYNPAQQQLQSPSYVSQFDPYASIGQGWNGENQMQNAPGSAGGGPVSTSTSPSGNPHPREYLRTHKVEIEAWDTYAWKQLLNAFDALKESWEGRTKELDGKIGQLQAQLQYGGGGYYSGQIQQEGSRLQGLLKEAQSHFDSVAASSFQMHEVFQGYRQSADPASKRRVREASNAALQGLPDWPPQVY